MLGLFGNKPVIDQTSMLWLFDAYDWALRKMDAGVFFNHSILVTPTSDHFPPQAGNDNEATQRDMAAVVFNRVREYAGLSHWPCELVDAYTPVSEKPQRLLVNGSLRTAENTLPVNTRQSKQLAIPYVPAQLAKPEVLVASFAHVLGHYLSVMSEELPPGGTEFWSHANDFLAIYMGFGLMVANTAYTYRGGCGSCYNPSAERQAFLSQDEATYALAIFSTLKNIPDRSVIPHLKKYLRPVYKNSIKDIQGRQEEINRLFVHKPA